MSLIQKLITVPVNRVKMEQLALIFLTPRCINTIAYTEINCDTGK